MSRVVLSNTSHLLSEVKTFLHNFQKSTHKFAFLGHAHGGKEIALGKAPNEPSPKTIFILDSSYNPPSKAHFALAYSAITSPAAQNSAKPHSLLLLFSTANADKAPKPASFEQRLAMMSCLMADITQSLASKGISDVSVGIGVTTEPYYVGKSQAIAADEESFPEKPKHVHIIGYDTVTRFLAPKYYKGYDPPLSALEPYFDEGHSLLVALRPESSSENMKDAGSQAVEEQRAYVNSLSEGALREEGFKPQWAKQISVMEENDLQDAVGVSSTAIRDAVREEDRTTLDGLCTPNVAAWVKEQRPYAEDEKAEI